MGSSRAKNDDHLWFYDRDLAKNERPALHSFVGFGLSISGWTASVDVPDAHVFATYANTFDNFRQQLARSPDEWKALFVLVRSGCLADKHQVGMKIPGRMNDLFPPACVQFAPSAIADVGPNRFDCVRGFFKLRCNIDQRRF